MGPMRCWDAQVFPEWYRQGKAEAEPATESSSWLSPLNHSYVGCLGKRRPALMDAQNQGLGTTWKGGLSVRSFINLEGSSLSSANVLSGVSHRHQCAPGGLDSMPGSSWCSSETLSRPVIPPTSGVRVNADTELTLIVSLTGNCLSLCLSLIPYYLIPPHHFVLRTLNFVLD